MPKDPTNAADDIATSIADDLDARLADADRELASRFPGERSARQPVHTVYVPADRFQAGLAQAWGAAALELLEAHLDAFEAVVGDRGDRGNQSDRGAQSEQSEQAADIVAAVREKLRTEPIEDLRIDFEDGYGIRDDADEDDAVDRAAAMLRAAIDDGSAPPFSGIRFKSFEQTTRRRGVRTLTRFLERVSSGGALPEGFVVTLPKVTSVEQVTAMVHAAERIEAALRLTTALSFEIQVETPQSILGPDGTALVARMIHAAAGRCTGLHYGTYDYSASTGIAAPFQALDHPAADHAKAVMQVAAAGTGVRLSDGSTNVIPVGDPVAVSAAWTLHHSLVRRSLERGYYQGWDLHPGHLPTRYAAVFAFYRSGLGAATARLRSYAERSGSGFMDEPATARALADFVLRGIDCGAVDEATAVTASGLDRRTLAVLAKRA